MPSDIPADKAALLDEIALVLRAVPGMQAVALGGSHARGTHGPGSDFDIGLYYREASPFRIEDIKAVAHRFAMAEPTVTGFYEWGPFVNGGAWIANPICKIDFLYRNLDQLDRTVHDAQAGQWEHSFDQQPPFGFRSVTTLGEIHCCKPLHDPSSGLTSLKSEVAVFPSALKNRIVQDTLWAAEFSFVHADNFARSGDVPNTVACMTRIFHYLEHALFAINERYLINDKRIFSEIEAFSRCPRNFGPRISAIFGNPGHTPDSLDASLQKLQNLFRETVMLAEKYAPRFKLMLHGAQDT